MYVPDDGRRDDSREDRNSVDDEFRVYVSRENIGTRTPRATDGLSWRGDSINTRVKNVSERIQRGGTNVCFAFFRG